MIFVYILHGCVSQQNLECVT